MTQRDSHIQVGVQFVSSLFVCFFSVSTSAAACVLGGRGLLTRTLFTFIAPGHLFQPLRMHTQILCSMQVVHHVALYANKNYLEQKRVEVVPVRKSK